MAWSTPKTSWGTDDAVGTTDLNRIELNSQHLNGSNSDLSGMATIASANNLDVEKRFNIVTGTVDILYIKSTGFVAGAELVLYFTGASADIFNLQANPPSGYAQIKTMTGGMITGFANRTYLINYDGTYWNLMGSY